jgi:hypothetical protein
LGGNVAMAHDKVSSAVQSSECVATKLAPPPGG